MIVVGTTTIIFAIPLFQFDLVPKFFYAKCHRYNLLVRLRHRFKP
jgi:hypothetical protein